MIAQIKTALLGEQNRTDGGSIFSSPRNGTEETRTGPDTDLTEDTSYDPAEIDQIFGILRNQRRRYVLKCLKVTEETIALRDLAEQVAAWECDKQIEQVTAKERKRVYVGLYQSHLPKMADVSAISYDKRAGYIEPGERFDRFTHYLHRDNPLLKT